MQLLLLSVLAVIGATQAQNQRLCRTDVVFCVDTSMSIMDADFKHMQNYMKAVTEQLYGKDEQSARFSIVRYSDKNNIVSEVQFNSYESKADLHKAIDNLKKVGYNTMTTAAMKFVQTESFKTANGARDGATKVIIVLTDGNPSDGINALKATVADFKKDRIYRIAVGVGAVDTSTLEIIANQKSEIMKVDHFSQLDSLVKRTADIICPCKVDVCFMVDTSLSILDNEWEVMKTFMKKIVENTEPGADGARFCVVPFSDANTIKNQIPFDAYNEVPEILPLIDKIPKVGYNTMTGKAMEFVRTKSFVKANGAREGVPKVLVIITDGNPSDGSTAAREIEKYDELNYYRIAVGIKGVDERKLTPLASNPTEVMYADDFNKLDKLIGQVTRLFCQCVFIDLMFVLDSSMSLSDEQWTKQLKFVQDVVKGLDNVGLLGVQVGVVKFSDSASLEIKFKDFKDLNSLLASIAAIPRDEDGETYTAEAMKMARTEGFSKANGGRGHAAKWIILITDGYSASTTDLVTEMEIQNDFRILRMAIGVGGVDKFEMEAVAGKNGQYFQATDFDKLQALVGNANNGFC